MQKQKISYLFDTNALVYWVHKESTFYNEVEQLISELLKEDGNILALSSSLSDVYYILCHNYTTEEVARDSILLIAQLFDLVDLTGEFVFEAIASNEPDYEDGLIRTAAETLEVDGIISYDKKAFANSFIPKMTAKEAIRLL